MPWYAWYVVIGFGWMLIRLAMLLIVVWLYPPIRGKIDLTPSSYVQILASWPIDVPYIAISLALTANEIWSAYRFAKAMKKAGL